MNEPEYIRVSNLTTLRHITTMLRHVMHGDEKGIPYEEYCYVLARLYEWESRHENDVKWRRNYRQKWREPQDD